MHSRLCVNTHHDVTTVKEDRMVEDKKIYIKTET